MNKTINDVVNYLNQLLEDDPDTIHKLFEPKIPCREELDIPAIKQDGVVYTSPLGLLNGVLDAIGLPYVVMYYKDSEGVKEITGFKEI